MARLYKPFRARHSELMSQSLSSFLRQDVPASALKVAVALQRFSPADSGAVAQALPLLLDRAGLASSFSLRSAHVLVKPNLLTATPLACTSPVVVAAVCRWLLDQGARVRVGDSPGFGTATAVARQTGVEEALRPLGLRVESLADPRPLELPLRRGGPVSFGVARVALESDVIFSLPRVKAHSQMRLTQLTNQISERQATLEDLASEQVALTSKYEQQYNADFIADYAENTLGMVKLGTAQVEYLELSSPDEIEVSRDTATISGAVGGLVRGFTAILEYLR